MRPSVLLFVALFAVPLSARSVVFVDNTRTDGNGTPEKPFATLAQAQAASGPNAVIYVAEGNAPYEGGIALKPGQMLIGSAYGLDAAVVEFKTTIDAPSTPAIQGPGPTIHGNVWLNGDNVVAGVTIAAESGYTIGSSAPDSPVTLRNVYLRPTKGATGISLQNPGAVSIHDGGIEGATFGSAFALSGGSADVRIEHFPIRGSYGAAIAIDGRMRGTVVFGNRSPVSIDGATNDAISIANSSTLVIFNDPVKVVTQGGRGVVANKAKVRIAGGSVDTTNAAAVEVHDSDVDITLTSLSAAAKPPGRMTDGVILDKLRGKFTVTGSEEKAGTGGTIDGAQSYGIRITQSSGVRLSHMTVTDSGSANAVCAEAIERETNVRCRAAIFLRHVSGSAFQDIAVRGGAGVGINANNITGLTFSNVTVDGAGSTAQEPALLIQEGGGTITFTLCRFADSNGGSAFFEQRFRSAVLKFDRCDFGAPQHPSVAPWLVRSRVAGAAALELVFDSGRFHDNSGGAILVEAIGTAAAKLRLHDSIVYVGGGTDRSAIVVASKDGARSCLDVSGNTVVTGADKPAVWLSNQGVKTPVDPRLAVVAGSCP